MIRPALLYFILVLLPAGTLGLYAFRAAERDYREGLEAHRSRIGAEARDLVRRVENGLEDARRAPISPGSVGFTRGEGLVFDAEVAAREPASYDSLDGAAEGLPDELRLFELSLQGGESFEFTERDPERALDAYSFYLPRIRAEPLRARLRFRMARAALAASREALGRALLDQLIAPGTFRVLEGGLPVGALAAERLLELCPVETANTERGGAPCEEREAVRKILESEQSKVPTSFLVHLVERGELRGPLAAIAANRRRLETAVRAHREILASRKALLTDAGLLLNEREPQETAVGLSPLAAASRREAPTSLRRISLRQVELPELAAGEFRARLEFYSPALVSPEKQGLLDASAALLPVLLPVRLGEAGPEVASLIVDDPGFEVKMGTLSSRRDLQRLLVAALFAATLAGGGALLWALARERSLARLRSRLLANVSHELKTPVTSIRMFSEMLAGETFDPERTRRFGDLLRSESGRLSRLIEDLLDFSRLGRKEVELPHEPVDLDGLARGVAEGFSLRARESGVEFRLEGSAGAAILTNGPAIERILSNLLDNALKYRRKETPGEAPWIRLVLSSADREARVAVLDNGIGIARRDRERVFEEFYRARYEDYAVPGSGLGLSIARKLARGLGGEILLESEPGRGSEFTLHLPRRVA